MLDIEKTINGLFRELALRQASESLVKDLHPNLPAAERELFEQHYKTIISRGVDMLFPRLVAIEAAAVDIMANIEKHHSGRERPRLFVNLERALKGEPAQPLAPEPAAEKPSPTPWLTISIEDARKLMRGYSHAVIPVEVAGEGLYGLYVSSDIVITGTPDRMIGGNETYRVVLASEATANTTASTESKPVA